VALTVGELVAILDVDNDGLDRGIDHAHRRFDGLQRDANGRLRDMRGRFVAEGRAAGRGLADGIEAGSRRSTRAVGGLISALRGVGAVTGLIAAKAATAGLLVTVVTALPHVLALGAAVAATAPAAAVAVPAVAGLVAVLGTMQLALHGVSDALAAAASGDAGKFAKALRALSPAAAAFVREAAGLIPTLREVRRAVQEAFFARLGDGLLTRVVTNLLPAVRAGLVGVASVAGEATRRVGLFLASGEARSGIGVLLGHVRASLTSLVDVPAKLMRAFLEIGTAAGPALQRLSRGLAGIVDRFAGSVDRTTRSGSLTAMIDRALDLLGQLGRIAGNVGRIIGALFGAGGEASAGLLDTIERVTGAIAEFANSAEGQRLLGTFLGLLADAGPVLLIAAGLASAVSAVASAVAAVATPVGAAVAVLALLAVGFATVYARVRPVREAVQATFAMLAPIVAGSVATILRWLRGQLIPALADLGATARPVLDGLAGLWQHKVLPAIELVARAYQAQLRPTLDKITDVIVSKVMPAVDSLTAAYQRNRPEIEQVVGWLSAAVAWFGKVGAAVAGPTVRALIALGGALLSHGINNLGRMINILGAAVRWFNSTRDSASRLGAGVAAAVGAALRVVSGLPGRARAAVGNLGSLLYGAGRSLIQGLINGVNNMLGALRSTLGQVTDLIADWKGPESTDARLLYPAGRSILGGLIGGIASQTGALRAELSGVTAMIARGLPAGSGRLALAGGAPQPARSVDQHTADMRPLLIEVRDAIRELYDAPVAKIGDETIARAARSGDRTLGRR